MSSEVQRKLTTILAADAEGYSREMDVDEVRTFEALQAARGVFAKFIERHRGRIANTAGDGLIAEFPSVVEAVQCAIEVQRELGGKGQPKAGDLRFRIGIHLGDVLVDGDDLLGEGVNLAARLQGMAEAGGVLISQQVYDQVYAKLSVGFEYLGEKRPKNFIEDVPVYRIDLAGKLGAGGHHRDAPYRKSRAFKVTGETPSPVEPAAAGARAGLIRQAKMFGVGLGALLLIDLATGGSFWAHWIAIVMAIYLGWKAAPFLVNDWFSLQSARFAVIVGALAVINFVTWTGYLWFLWPAGALVVVELLRRLGKRSKRL